MQTGKNKRFGGKTTHFDICRTIVRLVIRFVTSIVLGIAYGRRILDLKDEMVTCNREFGLGKSIETLLGRLWTT